MFYKAHLNNKEQPEKVYGFLARLGPIKVYRDELNGMSVLLSKTLKGPGRDVKGEQEENSRNHVHAF